MTKLLTDFGHFIESDSGTALFELKILASANHVLAKSGGVWGLHFSLHIFSIARVEGETLFNMPLTLDPDGYALTIEASAEAEINNILAKILESEPLILSAMPHRSYWSTSSTEKIIPFRVVPEALVPSVLEARSKRRKKMKGFKVSA